MGRPTAGPAGTWLATLRKGGTERFEVSSGPGSSHSVTSDGDVTVLFDGLLHSRREWLNHFSLPTASDASLVLNAYLRWGEGVLERVKGLFALIVWDGGKDLLLCARDPHGMHPCFYADEAGDLFLSASAQALARDPRIPGTIDRVAIADHLCHRWPKLESTYFDAVRRLPGGYALRIREGRRTVARYWDPIPPGRPIDYITDEEAGRFPELLDQAVDRCLPGGPAAIYLSGGLDSVSIAALAQEQLRDRDVGPLLALSLVFEHPDANEEGTQRAVAARLGLPQKIVTVGDAVGPNGLLADALEMSASRSAPMMNLWNPAYAFLARYAAEQDCEVILTGNGGDEWLEAGVHNARLALKRLDFATVYRLWAMHAALVPLFERHRRPQPPLDLRTAAHPRRRSKKRSRANCAWSPRAARAIALRADDAGMGCSGSPAPGLRCSSGIGRTNELLDAAPSTIRWSRTSSRSSTRVDGTWGFHSSTRSGMPTSPPSSPVSRHGS